MPLLLLPNLLGSAAQTHLFLPASVDIAMTTLDGLIAESEGGGRSYLKRFRTKKRAHEMPIALLNPKMDAKYLDFLLEPIIEGETWGVVSDSGLPCLADPGSALVLRARQLALPLEAFVGPSSIFLSLMQSGLPGQRFVFHGYIAKEPENRKKELKAWENSSKKEQETHIFIEAPYRNLHTLASCLEVLSEKTLLSVACDLTLPTQEIKTGPLFMWKKGSLPEIAKRPAIFLFYA